MRRVFYFHAIYTVRPMRAKTTKEFLEKMRDAEEGTLKRPKNKLLPNLRLMSYMPCIDMKFQN